MKKPHDFALSTKTFIISHLTILILALLFFAGLYYILYQEKFQGQVFQYNPVTREPVSLFLEVGNPQDDTLVFDDSVIVSGSTSPDSPVIISSESNDAGVQSGKDGEFSKVFTLSPGVNTIKITVFDPEGNSKTVTKSIYYSEDKF